MNRKSLREQIFKLLFRTEFNDFSEMDDQVRFFFESGDMTVSEKDQKYITDKCLAIVDKIPEIDALLDEKLEGWTVDRLPDAVEAFKRGAQTVTTNCAKKLLDQYSAVAASAAPHIAGGGK